MMALVEMAPHMAVVVVDNGDDRNAGNRDAGDGSRMVLLALLRRRNPRSRPAHRKRRPRRLLLYWSIWVYRLYVINDGPSDITGATVTDTWSGDFDGVNAEWNCDVAPGSGGSSCGSGSGTGNLNTTVDILAGDTVIFYITAEITGTPATLSNTATVTNPETELDGSNNSATDDNTPYTDQSFGGTNPVCNPDVVIGDCDQFDIIMVVDMSGSIASGGSGAANTQAVRDAVVAVASALSGTGARMAVVIFNTTAFVADITGGGGGYDVVDATYVTQCSTWFALAIIHLQAVLTGKMHLSRRSTLDPADVAGLCN